MIRREYLSLVHIAWILLAHSKLVDFCRLLMYLYWSLTSKGSNPHSFASCKVLRIEFFYGFLFVSCSRHPEVKWAQRIDKVYITVQLADAKDAKVNLEPEGVFSFSATAGTDGNLYESKLELNDKVNVEVIHARAIAI